MNAHKFALVILLLTLGVSAAAQNSTSTVPKRPGEHVNVKGFRQEGGLVNVVAGEANLLNQNGLEQTLKAQQQFEAGDEIQVATKSYVELLLNPGTYLRLAPNTRVKVLSLAPENLKMSLLSGSLIL